MKYYPPIIAKGLISRRLLASYFCIGAASLSQFLLAPILIAQDNGVAFLALMSILTSVFSYSMLVDFGLAALLARGRLTSNTENFAAEAFFTIRKSITQLILRSMIYSFGCIIFLYSYFDKNSLELNSITLCITLLLLFATKPFENLSTAYLNGSGLALTCNLTNAINTVVRWTFITFAAYHHAPLWIIFLIYLLLNLPLIALSRKLFIGIGSTPLAIHSVNLRTIWSYQKWAFITTTTSIIALTIDKLLIVNHHFPQEQINAYLSSWTLIAPLMSLIYPIAQMQQPIVSKNFDQDGPKSIFHALFLVTVLLILPVIIFIAYTPEILEFWLRKEASAFRVSSFRSLAVAISCMALSQVFSLILVAKASYKELTMSNLIVISSVVLMCITKILLPSAIEIYQFFMVGTFLQMAYLMLSILKKRVTLQ